MGFPKLPPLPLIQESKADIAQEAVENHSPVQQQNIDLGAQDKQATMNFWEGAQDFSGEIAQIKAMLEGKAQFIEGDRLVWKYPTDEFGKPIKKPFCSPEGQSWIMSFIAPYLSKGTPLSHYSIETMLNRCDEDAEVLNEIIYLQAREWKIDPVRMGGLIEVIMDRIEAARRRAVDDKERDFVGKAVTVLANLTGSTQPKAPGLISLGRQGRM